MTDNRTLDEIKQDDIGMLEDLLKNSKEYWFNDEIKCRNFVGKCLFGILEKCGVKINEKMNPKMVDRLLETHDVKVENRTYDAPDEWKSGQYVYKKDQIAGFVSLPCLKKRSYLSLSPSLMVRTNVEL